MAQHSPHGGRPGAPWEVSLQDTRQTPGPASGPQTGGPNLCLRPASRASPWGLWGRQTGAWDHGGRRHRRTRVGSPGLLWGRWAFLQAAPRPCPHWGWFVFSQKHTAAPHPHPSGPSHTHTHTHTHVSKLDREGLRGLRAGLRWLVRAHSSCSNKLGGWAC